MNALLVLLVALVLFLVAWGLSARDRVLQFPFLLGVAVLMQVVPELRLLQSGELALSATARARPAFMAVACLAMAAAGYFASGRPPESFRWLLREDRLFAGSVALVVLGTVFGRLIVALPDDVLSAAWTGRPVAYLFFAKAGVYGLAVLVILFLRTGRWLMLVVSAPIMMAYIDAVLIGRRTPTAEFFLLLMSLVWFNRRLTPPRWIIVTGILLFGIYAANVGEQRDQLGKQGGGRRLAARMIVANVRNWLDGHRAPREAVEMRNAMYLMDGAAQSGVYNGGAALYNQVIFAYVPAQIVGAGVKQSLMIETPDSAYAVHGYVMPRGTCNSGLADAFQAFGYLGALLFLPVGYVMRRLWEGAVGGNLVYQVMYVFMITPSLQTISIGLHNFTTPWFHMALFCLPVMLWSRVPESAPAGSAEGRAS